MLNVIAHARNLGYIKCEDNLLQPLHVVRQLPDEKSDSDNRFSRRVDVGNDADFQGEHPHLKIRSGDTVVFSANPIPGNTIAVVTPLIG